MINRTCMEELYARPVSNQFIRIRTTMCTIQCNADEITVNATIESFEYHNNAMEKANATE